MGDPAHGMRNWSKITRNEARLSVTDLVIKTTYFGPKSDRLLDNIQQQTHKENSGLQHHHNFWTAKSHEDARKLGP
ncbi:hypothetical protein K3495_g5005 [Podosphaera aphanis]|nr:hypothetical protein K3495_g5005 [Podosphaera aphanis]